MKKDKASNTAYNVLQGVIFCARQPQLTGLVDAETVKVGECILSASEEGRRRIQQLNSPIYRLVLRLMEWILLPGIILHYVLRKRFIEDRVIEAIASGVTQVINIGAGFDTLAWGHTLLFHMEYRICIK
jgi:O-methyltransferase involved in polyketide biosynthesis